MSLLITHLALCACALAILIICLRRFSYKSKDVIINIKLFRQGIIVLIIGLLVYIGTTFFVLRLSFLFTENMLHKIIVPCLLLYDFSFHIVVFLALYFNIFKTKALLPKIYLKKNPAKKLIVLICRLVILYLLFFITYYSYASFTMSEQFNSMYISWLKQLYKSIHLGAFFLFGNIVFVPLVEEMLFRGVLFRALNSSINTKVTAYIVSSFAWALLHGADGFYNILPHFLVGLLFADIYLKTNSLVPSIALHSTMNFVAELNNYILSKEITIVFGHPLSVFIIVFLTFSFITLQWYSYKKKYFYGILKIL